MRKAIVVLLVLAMAAPAVLFASAAEEAAAPAGPVTLRFAVWDQATTVYLQPMVDAFMAKNSRIRIQFVDTAANDYPDRWAVLLAGGDTTDLISIKDMPGYAGMATRNQILDLTPYITRDKYNLDQYSGLTNEFTVDGKLYSLPFRSDIWILYYNKSLFDKAGVPYPTNDMTWQQYFDLARRMTSGSGAAKVYGGHHHTWRSTTQLATVQDGRHTVIADDYSFMKWMYELMIKAQTEGTIMDWASQRAGNLHYRSLFYNQQFAMMPMGTWQIATQISAKVKGDAPFEWGIVKFPHPPGVPAGTTAGNFTGVSINARSANKDASWEFLKFFCGPEGADILVGLGQIPAGRTPEILAKIAAKEGFPAGGATALETVTVRLEAPYHPQLAAIEQILNEEHELILTGSKSIDAGLADMGRRVRALLGK
jgi:multiple sugar transport system substrate-binding protein